MNSEEKYERILVPFFGDEIPEKAQEKAIERTKKGGKIFLLHITDEAPTRSIRYKTGQLGEDSELIKTFRETRRKVQEDAAEEFIEQAKKDAAKHGISVESLFVVGDPGKEVLEAVDEHSIQLVVVESLREKITELFLGDEIKYIKKKAPCEVLSVS